MVELEPRNGFVYVVCFAGYHKIGRSKNPTARISSLGTSFPTPLVTKIIMEVPDAPLTERLLHDRFSGQRVHGEWFDLEDSDVALIPDFIGKIDYIGQRVSRRIHANTPEQLKTYIVNNRAAQGRTGAINIRRLPNILRRLKPGQHISVSSKNRSAVRSIERKFDLKLCIVMSNIGMDIEKVT